ncbi:MAG: Nif3-like dinuclear metal center hexameric protein [Sodalis sp. (in: enterobacteria)]
MNNYVLEKLINKKLNSLAFLDHAPNGLQVEGREDVFRIVTGITACQALLDNALALNADAVIVHHGYFWKNETSIISGIKRLRLKTLLANNINLYAWHLPLDVHPELGNNAQLAAMLDIRITGTLDQLVMQGELASPLCGEELRLHIEQTLGRNILHCGNDNGTAKIKQLAWCTGGGQEFLELAAQAGMDAFITGEVSEQTVHIARERGIHFYSAGHHATECGGIRALGEWLTKKYDFSVTFIEIANPA